MNNREEKLIRDYMKLPYTVVLRRDSEGDIIAKIGELDGCIADGQDELEALANLEQVKRLWFAAALKAGQRIPKPEDNPEELPSGKFLTRVPRSLHRELTEVAKREGVSLNQLVSVVLAEVVGRKSAIPKQVPLRSGVVSGLNAGAYGGSCMPPKLKLVSPLVQVSEDERKEARTFLDYLVPSQLSSYKSVIRCASDEVRAVG